MYTFFLVNDVLQLTVQIKFLVEFLTSFQKKKKEEKTKNNK